MEMQDTSYTSRNLPSPTNGDDSYSISLPDVNADNDVHAAYRALFSASTGRSADTLLPEHTTASRVQAWQDCLTDSLPTDLPERIAACINPNAPHRRVGKTRLLSFVTEVVNQLRENPDSSIQTIERKLREQGIVSSSITTNSSAELLTGCVFTIVGWVTMLFKADPQEGNPLAIDTQGAPCFSAPNLLKSFASRSIAEVVSNMGEVLPVPARRVSAILSVGASQSTDTLHVASLNFDTLSELAGIRIAWVDTVSAHLDFDMTSLTLFLFRCPTFCELHATRHSLIAGILHSSIPAGFTVQGMMEEILVSYSLIFKLNPRAQQLFRKERAEINNKLMDPLLDTLCLDSPTDFKASWHRGRFFRPQKESFQASTEFPILSQRFLRLQQYIDGIPTNRISSLWKDRRDMSRWYTFWAVIWIGGAGLAIGVIQAALAAESVQLAREQLEASNV